MITPQEIEQKAIRLYPKFVKAWLNGQSLFPYSIKANLRLPKDLVAAKQAVELLRRDSKAERGIGYQICWASRKSRFHGLNRFPERLTFENEADFLDFVGKQQEFATLKSAVGKIRDSQPALEAWLVESTHWKGMLAVADIVADLLLMTAYLVDNPRPDCFAREIPLPVSTKLIEENKRLLSQWLDRLLPAEHIEFTFGHDKFERRYGLRHARQHLLVRILDRNLQEELGLEFDEFSLPAESIDRLKIAEDVTVFVVENKVNLLTLPAISRGIALGGLGKAISLASDIGWLSRARVRYWGDLDVEGFEMLGQFRELFPQAESLLMSLATYRKFEAFAIDWPNTPGTTPLLLNQSELETCEFLLRNKKRLEQERIPQSEVCRHCR